MPLCRSLLLLLCDMASDVRALLAERALSMKEESITEASGRSNTFASEPARTFQTAAGQPSRYGPISMTVTFSDSARARDLLSDEITLQNEPALRSATEKRSYEKLKTARKTSHR